MRYGNYSYDNGNENRGKYAESFGFEFRLYFGSMVEEVAFQPLVKLTYNGALGKYHTPLKNLEWYFEASIGNLNMDTKGVAFAGTTGITWYLPAL